MQESILKFEESTLENMENIEEESYIDRVSKLTINARKKKEISKNDLLNKYINDAVIYITKDIETKIIDDIKKGNPYSIMYSFSENYDKTIKSKFGPYLLKKLIFMEEFKKALTEYVNKNNTNSEKFYTSSWSYNTPEDLKMWNICIYWKDILDSHINEAVIFVSNDFETKIINNALEGHYYSVMYSFSENYDKTKKTKKTKFGPYLLKNFIRFEGEAFKKALTEHVNKNNDSSEKFYTYFKDYNSPKGEKMWNICVSWKNIMNKNIKDHPSKNRKNN